MTGRWTAVAAVACVLAGGAIGLAQPVPAAGTKAPSAAPPGLKPLLLEEVNRVEKEIATRMMRRGELSADKRAALESEIDARILQRAMLALAAGAPFESHEQAVAWLRAKAIQSAVASMERAMAIGAGPGQKDGMAALRKLSFTPVKDAKELDELCRSAAVAIANVASATPVTPDALPVMRPKPMALTTGPGGGHDRPPTVAELTDEVQRVAAISLPLRQQLLALAAATSAAGDDGESRALYDMLAQSVGLAKGLQSNTAVGAESRAAIETQLAEGIVLYGDPRTRAAGRARVDALGNYRQTLTRIGKMGLTKAQMDQLGPVFAWAQENPEAGAKVLAAIEGYFAACAKWDGMPQGVTIPAPLRRASDDLKAQFGKARGAFLADAARAASLGPAALEELLAELQRLQAVAEDVQGMQSSFDAINAYKIRPVGGIEKKATTAALAAASPTPSPNRADGQRYLHSIHSLARMSQALGARPLTDVPGAVLQAWGGGKLDAFDARWRAIVVELANSLNAGSLELDKAKVMRLEAAQAIQDALRQAAQLDAALPKTAALAKWADWAIEPAALSAIVAPYKETTATVLSAYAGDVLDQVERWSKMRGRYAPLVALILRDVAYAEQCEALPAGALADAGRLAAPYDGAPFATERYASYAVGAWAMLEKAGDVETADQLSYALAKRLARDLRLPFEVEEGPARTGGGPGNGRRGRPGV